MLKIDKAEIDSRVSNAIKMVDLVGSERKFPSQLSGGEQQRVALARSIVTRAKVLLLDEPFNAIDAKLRRSLQIKIKEIHDELGMTTVFVTHDQDEAIRMSHRIYLMNKGKVVQAGSPMDLYLNPNSLYSASFMGNYNILSAEQMGQISSDLGLKGGSYAIRPENICFLSPDNKSASHDCYVIQGIIKRVIPQGNTIRYTVLADEILLDVDTLNRHGESLKRNDPVQLKIEWNDIVHLEK